MRNHNYSCPLHLLFQLLTDFVIGFGIYCRQRIIKNKNWSFFHQHSCYGNTLFLSARQSHSSFSYNSVIAICKMLDCFVYTGNSRCMADFLIKKLLLCDTDIFPDSPGKQKWLLKHHSNILAQYLPVNFPDIFPSDGDLSALFWQIIKPVQKMDQSRFSASSCTKNCKSTSFRNGKIDIFQNRMIRRIEKRYIVKANITGCKFRFFICLCVFVCFFP